MGQIFSLDNEKKMMKKIKHKTIRNMLNLLKVD